MKKATTILIFVTLLAAIFGFFKDIILANYFGSSFITDVYIISMTIPALILAFFTEAVKSSYIPKYLQIQNEYTEEQAKLFTSKLINSILIIFVILVGFIILFTEQIVILFASGFDEMSLELAIAFTRISIFSIFFMGILSVLNSYLHLKGNFFIPMFSMIPYHLSIIISIILAAKISILYLPFGFLIASIIQLIISVPFVYKYKFKYIPNIKAYDKNVKEFAILILPIFLSVAINDINKIIDRTMASNLVIGGISALNYSGKLNSFIQSVIAISIATVAFPTMSKYFTEKNVRKFNENVTNSVILVFFLLIPISLGSIFYSSDIITLLYGRGEFDSQAIYMTSQSLKFYSVGILFFGLISIFIRVFYSMKITKVPLIASIAGVLVNILLNVYFFYYTNMGINGLALSTSISAILMAILMIFIFTTKAKYEDVKVLIFVFLKIFIYSITLISITKTIFYNFDINNNLRTLFSITITALIYFSSIYVLKIKEINTIYVELINRFKKIFKK
jgi:putative peptidoglycan lipid II flippase